MNLIGRQNSNYAISSQATFNIDCSKGNVLSIELRNAITTQTFSNLPQPYTVFKIELLIKQAGAGSNTIAWDASISWGPAGSITLSTTPNKIDIVYLYTIDGGQKWCATTVALGC